MYIAVPVRLNLSLNVARLDFWALPDYRLTGYLTERVEKAFYKRCHTEERPTFILDSEEGDESNSGNPHEDSSRQSSRPGKTPRNEASDIEKTSPSRAAGAGAKEALDGPRSQARGKPEKHDANLGWALHSVFWLQWWTAGICKLISGMCSGTHGDAYWASTEELPPRYTQHDHAARQPSSPKLAIGVVHLSSCER